MVLDELLVVVVVVVVLVHVDVDVVVVVRVAVVLVVEVIDEVVVVVANMHGKSVIEHAKQAGNSCKMCLNANVHASGVLKNFMAAISTMRSAQLWMPTMVLQPSFDTSACGAAVT